MGTRVEHPEDLTSVKVSETAAPRQCFALLERYEHLDCIQKREGPASNVIFPGMLMSNR